MMERAADLLSRWQPTGGEEKEGENQDQGDGGGSDGSSDRRPTHSPPSDPPQARTLPQSLFPPHLLAQHNLSWEQLHQRFIFVPRWDSITP